MVFLMLVRAGSFFIAVSLPKKGKGERDLVLGVFGEAICEWDKTCAFCFLV